MANAQGGAPTYDRLGIDSGTALPSLPPEQRDRVVAALRLGWEIEELVSRSYLLDEPVPSRPIPGTPAAGPPGAAPPALRRAA